MKLYYHQFGNGVENFGDDLNRWLWPKLLPDYLDEDARVAFVGIGTLLNDTLPAETPDALRRVIFSAGVGYGGIPRLTSADRVYCVRGPLSAQALGLPPESAITDGAALVRRVARPDSQKCCPMAFMPHIEMIADRAWQSVCAEIGLGYIDPRWPTARILQGIARTEVLLTEAMHGAIVADALRVPWVAVSTRPGILSFKWQDWCASVGVRYDPVHLPHLFNLRLTQDWLSPVRTVRYHTRRKQVLQHMERLVQNARPLLSRDTDLDRVTERLEECLDSLKADIAAGEYLPYPALSLREPIAAF